MPGSRVESARVVWEPGGGGEGCLAAGWRWGGLSGSWVEVGRVVWEPGGVGEGCLGGSRVGGGGWRALQEAIY